MLVSIIVPIYNMESSLETCLVSILGQTYKNIEVILVDDGSKDSSLEICHQLAKKDKRIKVIHTKNQGSGRARNVGIENATGNFAYFCDADDKLYLNAIEELVTCVLQNDCDLIVFGYERINLKENTIKNKRFVNKILSGKEVRVNYNNHFYPWNELAIQGAPWNKFFNLDVIKTNNIRFPDLRRHQDEVFIMRYMNHAQKVAFYNKILYTHYDNDISLIWSKFPDNYFEIVNKLYKHRKDLIMSWNEQNSIMYKKLNESYILGMVKALELSYNKKLKINNKQRYRKFLEMVSDENLISIFKTKPMNSYRYQRILVYLINNKFYRLAFAFIGFRVYVQQRFIKLFIGLKKLNYRSSGKIRG